jgi:hypothetical protein
MEAMRLTLLEGRRWWLGKRVDGFRKNDDTHVGLGVSGADQLHPNESGCAKTIKNVVFEKERNPKPDHAAAGVRLFMLMRRGAES